MGCNFACKTMATDPQAIVIGLWGIGINTSNQKFFSAKKIFGDPSRTILSSSSRRVLSSNEIVSFGRFWDTPNHYTLAGSCYGAGTSSPFATTEGDGENVGSLIYDE